MSVASSTLIRIFRARLATRARLEADPVGGRAGRASHPQPPQAEDRHEAEAPIRNAAQLAREAVELRRQRARRVAADVSLHDVVGAVEGRERRHVEEQVAAGAKVLEGGAQERFRARDVLDHVEEERRVVRADERRVRPRHVVVEGPTPGGPCHLQGREVEVGHVHPPRRDPLHLIPEAARAPADVERPERAVQEEAARLDEAQRHREAPLHPEVTVFADVEELDGKRDLGDRREVLDRQGRYQAKGAGSRNGVQ